MGWLAVKCRVQSHKGSPISTNVILIGAELSALSSNSLELLLRRCIGVANIHKEAFFANSDSIELSNDFVTNVSGFETINY